MTLDLPKNPTPAQLKDALAATEARVTDLEDRMAMNVEAIRAMLTVLHPDPDHSPVDEDPLLGPFHRLVMQWIEAYGRDAAVPIN